MKKLFLMLLISVPTLLCAQIIVPNMPLTDRELLLEVIKQQNKLSEQLIATNLEIKGIPLNSYLFLTWFWAGI